MPTSLFLLIISLSLLLPGGSVAAQTVASTTNNGTTTIESPIETKEIASIKNDESPKFQEITTSSLVAKIKELQNKGDGPKVGPYQLTLDGNKIRSDRSLVTGLKLLKITISPAFPKNDDDLLLQAAKIVAGDPHIAELRVTAQESRISYLVTGKIFGVIETTIPFTVSTDLTEEILRLSLNKPWWNFATFSGLKNISLVSKARYDTKEISDLRTLTFRDYLRLIQARSLELTSETLTTVFLEQ